MASRRRTHAGLSELAIQLIGIVFMMILMFQFRPDDGGLKAAFAIQSLATTLGDGLALLFVVSVTAALVIHSRRPRTQIERGNSTIFHNHVSKPSSAVVHNISSQLRDIDSSQFEKIVALTYRKLGYNVEHRGGANAHGGIDLIIKKVGRRTAVQCKHWKNWNVDVTTLREFLDGLKGSGIEQGILVTLNTPTEEAKRFAKKHNIEIISESKLLRMLESTDVRFDPEFHAIVIKKLCPECNHDLVLRTAA